MAIEVRCGQCNRKYRVDDNAAGKRVKCKNCGNVFSVPSPEDLEETQFAMDVNAAQPAASAVDSDSEPNLSETHVAQSSHASQTSVTDTDSSTDDADDELFGLKATEIDRGNPFERGFTPALVMLIASLALAGTGLLLLGGLHIVMQMQTGASRLVMGRDLSGLAQFLASLVVGGILVYIGRIYFSQGRTPKAWAPIRFAAFALGILGILACVLLFLKNGIVGKAPDGSKLWSDLSQYNYEAIGFAIAGALCLLAYRADPPEPVVHKSAARGWGAAAISAVLAGAGLFLLINLATMPGRTVRQDGFYIAVRLPGADETDDSSVAQSSTRPADATTQQAAVPASPEVPAPSPADPVEPAVPPVAASTDPATPVQPADSPSASTPSTPMLDLSRMERFDPPTHSPSVRAAAQPPNLILSGRESVLDDFSTIIYPAVAIKWMAVIKNGGVTDTIQLVDPTTWQASGRILVPGDPSAETAISPDGNTLLRVVMLPRPGIAVWSFATGRSEFTFETGSVRPDVIGFCSNDQFMVMGTPAGSGPRSMLQVMDVRTRKPLRNWQGNFTRDQVALSRDGKTLALPTEVNNVRQIQIWDATLANRPIRRLQFPGAEDSSVDLHALAFSNDGDRIAALIRIPNGRRLVCWQTGDGSVISDAAFPDITSTYLGGKSSQSSPIQWMRDDESVLLYGAMLVHVQTGRPVSLLETAGAVRSEYYQPNLLHVVRPSANNGQLNRIDELTLDLNALATIVQRARETGPLMVNPPGLPDSRLEWSTQRTTLLSSNSNANTRLPTPDPVVKPAAGFTNRPIPMSGSMEQLRDLVFPREGGQFAAAMYATVGIDRFHQTSEPLRAWVDKIDLATGRVESSTIVPMAARLIDISNDGSQLLLGSGRAAGTQNRFDRLDIWSTGSNGTHVAAIKAPANLTFDSAHFLGNDQILTRQGSTLVCWSIPQRRAIWAWANGIAGGPVFSPGGKYAVIAHDGRLRLMDTGRGAILMDLENPPVGASLSGNSCFSPDGRTFALMVGKNLFRWDITTGRAEPILESPAAGMIEYGSDSKHLLVGDQLVDPQTGQAIFAYDVRNGRHVHGGPGGRHWYLSTHPTDGTIYLCSTELPREQDLASAAAYAETPPLVRPGEALWVSVTGDSQINPTVQSVIQNRLKQAGFRIDENALVSVIVSARLGHSGGTVRINNGAETAELRQQVYACKVTYTDVNGKTLWEGKEWAVQAPKGFGAGVFIPTDEAENAYRKALAANVKLWAEMTELPEYVSETGGTTVRSRATLGVD